MDGKPSKLSYADGRPLKPRRPPMMLEHGCAWSLAGALVCGVIIPCGGFTFAMNGTGDFGGWLAWPLMMIVGGMIGGVLGPVVYASLHWLSGKLGYRVKNS